MVAVAAFGPLGCAGEGTSGSPPAKPAGQAGSGATGDPEFDACMAQVQPNCNVPEMDTAERMEVPCASMTMIPIPLSDGTNYGPVTIESGPYGGKLEWNEGAGTEFVNEVNGSEPLCIPLGIETFGEPASVNAELFNLRDMDYSLYTVFRPACFKQGEKYPVITWANGTCGLVAGYAPLLASLASHGFVIVASNSTWTNTVPTDGVQLRALDFAEALNADPNSVFYQRLDMTKVGAMGHSQGAAATETADDDPRVKAVIFWNEGTSNVKPFLDVSGERDVAATTPESLSSDVDGATQPGAWIYHHKILETGGVATGHLVLMMQPERVLDMTIAWWNWQLNRDEEAKKMFVGDDCGLCSSPDDFEFGHNSALE
jgi:hypothetical protein